MSAMMILLFIPARFGNALVLDDAFRCLVTTAHSILVLDYRPSNNIILSYYGNALHSLQLAGNDPRARYSS